MGNSFSLYVSTDQKQREVDSFAPYEPGLDGVQMPEWPGFEDGVATLMFDITCDPATFSTLRHPPRETNEQREGVSADTIQSENTQASGAAQEGLEQEYLQRIFEATTPSDWFTRVPVMSAVAASVHRYSMTHILAYLPKFDLRDVEKTDVRDPFIGNLEKQVRCIMGCLRITPFLFAMSVIDTSGYFANTLSSLAGFLGTSWFIITFDKISNAHLLRGLGDYITGKMLEPFLICFSGAIISIGVGWVKAIAATEKITESLAWFGSEATALVVSSLPHGAAPLIAEAAAEWGVWSCNIGFKGWLLLSSALLGYRVWRDTLSAIISFDQADLVNMGLTGKNAKNLEETAQNTSGLGPLRMLLENLGDAISGGRSRQGVRRGRRDES
jgi:hypothetical protein